ncbi:MAG: hypothetical protein U9R22_11715 [Pseudomonadota bacterium]|nr:hypothetical protein [Pseudomonadota bacterium]
MSVTHGGLAETVAPVDGRIGLVLGALNHAIHQTADGKAECPEGFHHTQHDNFVAQFPTEAAREAMLERYIYYTNRGPNGENVFFHPTVIEDPLPLREVQGDVGIGLDLDGKVNPRSFTSPEGLAGIDNQLYRVIGCLPGWRHGGTIEGSLKTEVRSSAKMRMLVELSEVDHTLNDDQITVSVYRGRDGIEVGPDGNLIPFRSQRIDYREGARYIHRMAGRIVDGVVISEPVDMIVPLYGPFNILQEFVLRDARFQLRLDGRGAQGYLGGYYDVERWWLNFTKMWGAHFNADVTGWSAPATYAGLRRLADAYPDEEGNNTAISGAYKLEFVRAFVIHDEAAEGAQVPGAPLAQGVSP